MPIQGVSFLTKNASHTNKGHECSFHFAKCVTFLIGNHTTVYNKWHNFCDGKNTHCNLECYLLNGGTYCNQVCYLT